ncbi:hypothetical protein HS088_TW23G00446 [Tripterygium wilfordii]|uniref:Methyltransferase-related protein n=1 Tax=Tripterygium wilfordii TaxID=458696 RepID=A0A7J7BV14_TRIWF|nr:uncharacterized protein LOC119992547 [Tripterygium wilfordii]KAF5725719.1 hypothetical protein HS088_TW23G00446 [Tripterygium wilfordii]
MCPLRFILVFFSALLAGYLTWRTVSSLPETGFNLVEDSGDDAKKDNQEQQLNTHKLFKGIQNGFWVFVDMASGRYLWKNLKEMKKD